MKTLELPEFINAFPAQDWFAVYRDDDGTLFADRVLCMVLAKDPSGFRFVDAVGTYAEDLGVTIANSSQFVQFCHKDELQQVLSGGSSIYDAFPGCPVRETTNNTRK